MLISRRLWFPLVFAVVLASPLALADDLDPPVTRNNITLQVPKGWKVDAKTTGHTLLVALAPQRDKEEVAGGPGSGGGGGEFQASITITQEPGSKVDGIAQQARIAREITGYKVAEAPAPVVIDGIQGVLFGGTFLSGKVTVRSRQYIFSLSNQLYVLTFTCLNGRWGLYRPLLEASVGTLSVKK